MRFIAFLFPLLMLAACATTPSPVPVKKSCKEQLAQDIDALNAELTALGYK